MRRPTRHATPGPGAPARAAGERIRVLHVINGLGIGGAEVMLERLLRACDPDLVEHEVVSLTKLGVVSDRIRQLGVRTHALGMGRGRVPGPLRMLRLARLIRRFRPDVVQTWMYHSNLLGGIAAKLAVDARILWGIHHSTLEVAHVRRTTRWTVALGARLVRLVPDRVVTVSRVSREVHVAAGYDPDKFVLIPNGFDLTQFRPDPEARREVRAELGVPDAAPVVGLVARVDPDKDHLNFIRAAARLAAREPEARFLLCGEDADAGNAALVRAIAEHGLRDRFLLLGRRDDVPRVLCALDVATLSSVSEAFPLAIGEAMACGVPCAVTDVGDSAHLVGDTGRVVPARDPDALADAWAALVRIGPEGRRALGRAARERIATHFGLPRIAEAYTQLYLELLGERRAAAPVGVPAASPPARCDLP